MQVVSDAWKELQKQSFIPGAYVELTLDVTDENARVHTTLNLEESEGFESYPFQWENIETYDASFLSLLSDNYTLISTHYSSSSGYVSGNRHFTYITFDYTTELPGVTIQWDNAGGEYATKFTVEITTQDGTTETIEVDDNTETESFIQYNIRPSYEEGTVSRCTVKVTVKKWSMAYANPKVKSFSFGATKTFGRDKIMNYSHSNTADPIASEAPVNEISFDLLDTEGLYNINNENGIYRYLMERNRVIVRYGFDVNGDGNIEWIKGSVFYLTGWDSSKSRLYTSFTARDVFGLLLDKCIYNFQFTSLTEDTKFRFSKIISGIIEDFLKVLNLPLLESEMVEDPETPTGVHYEIPDNFSISIPADRDVEIDDVEYKTSDYTYLEVLQYFANAVGCALSADRRGQIHIEAKDGWTYNYEDPMIINNHVLYSPLAITISEEIYAVEVTTADEEYVYDMNEYTPAGTNVKYGGTKAYADNPFVPNAMNYSMYVYNVVSNRKHFSAEFRVDPRIDVLDVVMAEKNTGEGKYAVKIESITINYNGGFKGSASGHALYAKY